MIRSNHATSLATREAASYQNRVLDLCSIRNLKEDNRDIYRNFYCQNEMHRNAMLFVLN